ncbi:MAG: Gfo/Idh/MocA family oxidoreductase [Kiritimatiellia bacterium]|nr:Gfo/Idh/MocA family oxidoreductase [Kiritimatiellia bacterium]
MKPLSVIVTSAANPHVKFYYEDLSRTELFSLKAFTEEDPARRQYAEDFFRRKNMPVRIYTDWKEMMEKHRDVEAVVVGSDNLHHHEQTLAAAALGMHVYSMKVLSMDERQCEEMIAACRRAGVLLQVELELHFNAQYRALRKAFREGRLGRLHSLYVSNVSQSPIAYYPNWGDPVLSYGKRVPIRPGETVCRGGALTDHPHPYDVIRWITGQEFKRIFAVSGRNMRPHLLVEDHVAITGELTDGTKVFINPSYSHLEENCDTRRLYWPKSLEVLIKAYGEKAMMAADFWHKPAYVMGANHPSPNRMIFEGAPGQPQGFIPPVISTERFITESRFGSFVAAVRGLRPVETPGEDGLAAVRVMNAAYESISTGKSVSLR